MPEPTVPITTEVDLERIDVPPANPRQTFDEDALRSLATSIESAGLLEAIIVRPRGERFDLVAGERRLRAVKLLGRSTIDASIRELDDRHAAEVRLLDNLDREDLTPVEEAAAFRALQDLGHTPESLAELTRRTEGEVANRLALLRLPVAWQDRIARGEISAAAGELLVPHAKHGDVLDAMLRHVNAWPMPLTEWRHRLANAVMAVSRSLDPAAPDGPRFDFAGSTAKLDPVDLEVAPGRVVRRAMNVELWDQRQDEADAAAAEADAEADAGEEPIAADEADAGDVAEPSSRPRRSAARKARRRDRADDLDLRARVGEWTLSFLRRTIAERLERYRHAKLIALADKLGFEPFDEWRLEREFLELFDEDRLRDLADELGVDVSTCEDRDLVPVLLHEAPPAVPQIVVDSMA